MEPPMVAGKTEPCAMSPGDEVVEVVEPACVVVVVDAAAPADLVVSSAVAAVVGPLAPDESLMPHPARSSQPTRPTARIEREAGRGPMGECIASSWPTGAHPRANRTATAPSS